MYFRDCKTLIVFERKIPLTLEFRFHQEWRPCIKPGFFPQISLLNISVYRLQPRLFIDSLSYLKKPKRTIKSYGSAARLGQTIVIKAWTSQNSFVGFVLFFFTIPWLVCFFFTLLPVIKLIKDHWHGSSVIINETYKFNLQSSIFNKIYNFNRSIQI